MSPTDLRQSFLVHRATLLRFLSARGAGDDVEDILHEVWLRVAAARPATVRAPLAFLMQTANRLMIDRYRARTRERVREHEWSANRHGLAGAEAREPSAERALVDRELLGRVEAALKALGDRPAALLHRHRIDGVSQRELAREFDISLSTVESDLRRCYAALAELKRGGNDEV